MFLNDLRATHKILYGAFYMNVEVKTVRFGEKKNSAYEYAHE